jgi:hypothetical protein
LIGSDGSFAGSLLPDHALIVPNVGEASNTMKAIIARSESLFIATIVFSTWAFFFMAATDAGEPPLDEQLKKLAPHTSGIALVEVVDLKEFDGRPMDGTLSLNVYFKLLRATGTTMDTTGIVLASSGSGPPPKPNAKPAPPGPVNRNTFKKGERYWIAFASYYGYLGEYPQGIVKTWPEKDAPKLLDEAVRADVYAHRPQHDPRNGLTHSYRVDKDKTGGQVRMEREGKVLWNVTLPGEKSGGDRYSSSSWRLLHLDHWPTCLEHADRTRTNWYLFTEMENTLENANPYQLPAAKYKVVHVLDAETGKTASIRVSKSANTVDAAVVHFYDMKTGKPRREERSDFLSTGGLAAGAKEEAWLRRIVRTFELQSGKLQSEEILRYIGGSTYVPVKKQ